MASDPHTQFLWWMILCISMMVIMFIHHLFKIYQNRERFKKGKRSLYILPLLLIIFGMLGILFAIIPIYVQPDSLFCIFAAHWGPSGYSLFKVILYYILVLRFIRTYKNSVIEYDHKKLNIWIFIIFIWTTANLIGQNIFAQNVKGKCEVAKPPIFIIGSMALLG